MFAGALDRRVQFQRITLADDGLASSETWANHGQPVWASKKEISDSERYRAGEVSANITTRFQVRYSTFTADLSPKDRIFTEARYFDIVGIKEIGRRVGFEITAAARADGPTGDLIEGPPPAEEEGNDW